MNRPSTHTEQAMNSSPTTSSGQAAAAAPHSPPEVGYRPVLDVARGVPAGFQAVALVDDLDGLRPRSLEPSHTVDVLQTTLQASAHRPINTFMSVPVPLHVLAHPSVRTVLQTHGDLSGIVLDITDFAASMPAATASALAEVRSAGALISVGGHETAQPELGSIVRLRPSIVRLGRAWVQGLDRSAAKRSAFELTGRLAGQLDAWILAEDVSSAAELRALGQLGVPLAQGPFIGAPQPAWPKITADASRLPPSAPARATTTATLRDIVQQTTAAPSDTGAVRDRPAGTDRDTVMVIDDQQRPVELLTRAATPDWTPVQIMTVNIDTSAEEAFSRAMARRVDRRFTPLVCTDAAGRFVGLLQIEHLVTHLHDGAR